MTARVVIVALVKILRYPGFKDFLDS